METLVDWMAVSVGANIGFVLSFFIRRRHIRRLWNWLRGRTPRQVSPLAPAVYEDPDVARHAELLRSVLVLTMSPRDFQSVCRLSDKELVELSKAGTDLTKDGRP